MEKLEVKYVPAGNGKKPTFLPSVKDTAASSPLCKASHRVTILLTVLAVAVSLALFCLYFLWIHSAPLDTQGTKDIPDLVVDESEEKGLGPEISPCLQPKEPGLCRAIFPRWYFDAQQGRCSQFTFGGCGGNANNFFSLSECQDQCESEGQKPVPEVRGEADGGTCNLSPTAGPCRGQLPRIYFDAEDQTCKKFMYGGCAGNENNFLTMQECAAKCTPKSQGEPKSMAPSEAIDNRGICGLKADTGLCRAAIERWFYHEESGACKVFIWGGCGGNDNNFSSKEKCEQTCGKEGKEDDPCSLPSQIGPCRAAYTRFFYNAKAGECQRFLFGGCDGNENNFEEKSACEQRCL